MGGSLAEAVLRSVKSRGDDVGPKDQALVDLAMRYAVQIDSGIDTGGYEATKALYLGPHLLKALVALGCTPVNPDQAGKAPSSPRAEDELAAFRTRHRGGA